MAGAPAGATAPAESQPQPSVQVVVAQAEEDDEPEVDARFLYVRNCAGCHNENGDGKGPTMLSLGKEARSFAQGGFAFGNTRDALFRTISSGVPGTSLMPAFAGTLGEEERWMIVDYVLTLTPQSEQQASGTQLSVAGEPVVARGLLDPIGPGTSAHPRGLLIGFPGGQTFEYATDDVRLLGVRAGDFVERTDWDGRGGSPLRPLGEVRYLVHDGAPGPTYSIVERGVPVPIEARLHKTWVRGERAGIDSVLLDAEGRMKGFASEECRPESPSIGFAFTRAVEVRAVGESATLLVDLAGSTGTAEWLRGLPKQWQKSNQFESGPIPKDGWIVSKRGDGRFECVRVRSEAAARLVRDVGMVRVQLPAFIDREKPSEVGPAARASVAVVVVPEWSPELLQKLEQELAP